MAISREEFLAQLPDHERAAIRAGAAREIAMEYCRRKVRQARKEARAEIAERLHVDGGVAARIEARAEQFLETLRKRIEAAGGKLTLVAEFPDGTSARIDRLSGLKGKVSKARTVPLPAVEAAKPTEG